MVNATRKNRTIRICKMLTNRGANVLRAKTRNNAMNLMKNIPYTTPKNYNNGIRHWIDAQIWKKLHPTESINTYIRIMSPKVLESCIRNRKIPNTNRFNTNRFKTNRFKNRFKTNRF